MVLQKTNCLQYDFSCDNFTNILAVFTWGYFIKSIFLTSLVLFVFPERAFKWWKWFAIVSIPLLTWWIIPPGGYFFGRQAADKISALLFFGVSLLIAVSAAIYNYFKVRKNK